MRAILLIARRELAGYLRTMSGYVIIACALAFEGLAFNAFTLGGSDKYSADVLSGFFFWASGTTMVASVFISMRLLAEERQSGTLMLLYSSPVRDSEIILGKFLSAFAFVALMIAASAFLPMLVMVNGKVSWGHVASGYLGLLLLGGASLAIGTLGSVLARNQILAGIVSGVMLGGLTMCWWLAQVTERPLSGIFTELAIWNEHFMPFMNGLVHTRDIVFYLIMIYVFLFASTRVLEARRWK